MPRCNGTERAALVVALLMALAGCAGQAAQRAEISAARPLPSVDGSVLEVSQDLRFSKPMRDALDAGLPLRLSYRVRGCAGALARRIDVDLRHSALTRRYELHVDAAEPRYFARRSALYAALDQLRLPLGDAAFLDCPGSVQLHLDLAALPAPLRLPALLQPQAWRMRSTVRTWTGAAG